MCRRGILPVCLDSEHTLDTLRMHSRTLDGSLDGLLDRLLGSLDYHIFYAMCLWKCSAWHLQAMLLWLQATSGLPTRDGPCLNILAYCFCGSLQPIVWSGCDIR